MHAYRIQNAKYVRKIISFKQMDSANFVIIQLKIVFPVYLQFNVHIVNLAMLS